MIILLISSTAAAAAFSDDSETGTVTVNQLPAGKWDKDPVVTAGCELLATGLAAHRGAFGFSAVDADSDATEGIEVKAVHLFPTPYSSQYVRMWFRITASNGQSKSSVTQLIESVDWLPVAELFISFNNGKLWLGGFDAAKNYTSDSSDTVLVVGDWHLLEYSATGVGTAAGTRSLWVDGVLKAQRTGLNFVGRDLVQVQSGEPWGNATRQFQGTLDYDDVASDPQPIASTLKLGIPVASLGVGSCMPVEVSLQDSLGALAPSIHFADVELGVSGVAGGFFSDPGCTAAISNFGLAESADQQTVYFRADGPGSANLSASHVDFVSGNANVKACTASGDCGPQPACTGTDCPAQAATKGGCSSAGNGLGLVAAGVAASMASAWRKRAKLSQLADKFEAAQRKNKRASMKR